MDKLDTVAQLIELRKHNTVSMEGIVTQYSRALAKVREWLRNNGSGTVQKLGRQPWQDPSFRKMILNDLTDLNIVKHVESNSNWGNITGRNAGWFMMGGRSIVSSSSNNLRKLLEEEIVEYRSLMDSYGVVCLKYLDWALNCTQAILLADHRGVEVSYDLLIKDRPETTAEAVLGKQVYWLGFIKPKHLSIAKKFADDQLTVFDIPVKPGKATNIPVPGIAKREIHEYAKLYALYDTVIDELNILFEKMDRRIKGLKTYREIVKTDSPEHRIMTDIDQEMMLYFNVELFSAMYSRAGSIQDALGQYLYTFVIRE